MIRFFEGIQYRNRALYALLTHLKFPFCYSYRFRLAAVHVAQSRSVCDVCAGTGEFRNYVPTRMHYHALECESNALASLNKKKIAVTPLNLFAFNPDEFPEAETIVMIVSLYQFRECADTLLDTYRKKAQRVVIVESVLSERTHMSEVLKPLRNFLCRRPYMRDTDVYTYGEFEEVMKRHGFSVTREKHNHCVAVYNRGVAHGN